MFHVWQTIDQDDTDAARSTGIESVPKVGAVKIVGLVKYIKDTRSAVILCAIKGSTCEVWSTCQMVLMLTERPPLHEARFDKQNVKQRKTTP